MQAMIKVDTKTARVLSAVGDIEVYQLHDDGSESLVEYVAEINNQYQYGIEGEVFGEPYEGFEAIDLAAIANTIEAIKAHPVYQKVLKDAFGGVMYNVGNRSKYDADELIMRWDSLTRAEQESCDGVMMGAFGYLKGTEV